MYLIYMYVVPKEGAVNREEKKHEVCYVQVGPEDGLTYRRKRIKGPLWLQHWGN